MQKNDYEELLKLCRDVIPKTWNVYKYCDIESFKNEKGILNIEIKRYGSIGYNNDKNCLGHVRRIQYLNGVGHIKISLHCYPFQEIYILLHELAHVAVFRLQSFITKSYKTDFALSRGKIIEPGSHGKVFMRFLNIFRNRAINKGWSILKDTKIVKGGHLKPKPLTDEKLRELLGK